MRISDWSSDVCSSDLDGTLLPLMEAFYTIQGEGFHTGKAAYFIRLGGCDVGCHWCDVKESWDASIHPLTPADEIVQHAGSYQSKRSTERAVGKECVRTCKSR